jgi:hypothetical protein
MSPPGHVANYIYACFSERFMKYQGIIHAVGLMVGCSHLHLPPERPAINDTIGLYQGFPEKEIQKYQGLQRGAGPGMPGRPPNLSLTCAPAFKLSGI